MLVIPAIDLKDGRCVRLRQGDMKKETVFSDRPDEVARKWEAMGAQRIHVVDLNGAVEGRPVNRNSIEKIVGAVSVPIQLGGGIRDLDTVAAYLSLGVSQVILGTVALERPALVIEAAERYPGKIMLAIDAMGGKVASRGWTAKGKVGPLELARQFDDIGLEAFIYTDISRDGMKTGPNIAATRALAKEVVTPVIASGGISGLEDVKAVLELKGVGVMGMITGRALYDGNLDLGEAIRLAMEVDKK